MTRHGARALALAAACVVSAACTAARDPAATVTPGAPNATPTAASVVGARVNALFAAADEDAVWSIRIEREDTRAVLVDRQSNRLVVPASNMKIATLAAAAIRLGWDYRFRTVVSTNGVRDGHVLRGDLIVVGGADPTIGSGPDPMDTFREWARQLRDSGLRRVDGDLVGDPSRFGQDWLGAGWSWDYLVYGYGAAYSGLSFHENVARVTVTPASSAESAAIVTLDPPGSGLDLCARVRTSPAGSAASLQLRRAPGSPMLIVEGAVPVGSERVEGDVSVPEPALFFLRALRTALAEAGIEVRGDTRRARLDGDAGAVLVSHASAPLAQVAQRFMKVSQNLYGEALLRVLAPARSSSMAAAHQAAEDALVSTGVQAGSVRGLDGSGLSRRDFVTAHAIVTLLHAMAQPPHREPFRDALPVAGVDGTLASRFGSGPCSGRLRAKTGTLSQARALSGYVTSASGTPYVFSVIANNYRTPTSHVDAVVEEALTLLCAS